MTTIPHTIKRNETYNFNFRLNKSVYRKSLKTDSPSLCRAYVSDIMGFIRKAKYLGNTVSKKDIDKFIEMLISNKVNEVARLGTAMTQPLSDTANNYFQRWFKLTDTRRYSQYMSNDYSSKFEFPSFQNWLSIKMNDVVKKSPLDNEFLFHNPEEEGADIDIDHYYYHDFINPTIHQSRYDYLENAINNHATKIAEANKNNLSTKVRFELDEINQKFSEMLPQHTPPKIEPINSQSIQKEDMASPLFEEIEEEYFKSLALNPNIGKTTIDNKRSEFRDLESAFEGFTLNEITVDDIEERWASVCRLPKLNDNIAKKYKFYSNRTNITATERKRKMRQKRWSLIFNADEKLLPAIVDSDLIGKGQLSKLRTLLKELFTFAKRKNYIIENPFIEYALTLNIPKNRSKERTVLPADKAKLVVEHCFENLDHPYSWATLLMAYQGMRNKEVTSLTASQIITDQKTSIVYINILKGKTNNAKRKIPVHSELLKKGFLHFVDSKTGQNLFDFTSNQLTNNFTFYRNKYNIPPIDHDGNQLVLYSFRHNVISFLGEVSGEFKYRLIGHGNRTVTTGYTKLELAKAQELINKVNY